MQDTRAGWLHPLLILLVVLLGYGIAPRRLTLIGEEPVRAIHGIEMVRSGDWLVPTLQGIPIIDRPPLQYWTLALVHRFIHPLDLITLRMTALVITLITGLGVWLYARRMLSPAGALVAGLAFPTMGHVFDLGRRAEADGLFTLLMGGSLLLWHYGYREKWAPLATWGASCAVAALATLTKGTQGPVTFFGAIGLFLLLRRDLRFLRSGAFVVGLAVFAALVAIWLVPFQLREGWLGARMTWVDPFLRRQASDPLLVVRHLFVFPLEVLVASLPWSALLFGLLVRGFWRARDELRSSVIFALLGSFVLFAPVWISADGKARYVMPLYPLLAATCGVVAHRALEPDAPRALRRLWHQVVGGTSIAVAIAGLALVAARVLGEPGSSKTVAKLWQPWWLSAGVLSAAVVVLVLDLRERRAVAGPRMSVQAVALAGLVAIVFNGPVLNSVVWNTDTVAQEVAELRRRLPEGAVLHSLGPVHRKFVYWYGEPIPIIPWKRLQEWPAGVEYFAYDVEGGREPALPVAFEELARIDMNPKRTPRIHVVVGRYKTFASPSIASGARLP